MRSDVIPTLTLSAAKRKGRELGERAVRNSHCRTPRSQRSLPFRFAALSVRVGMTVALLTSCATQKPLLDLKIINGRIIDGTGAPWFRGDVGIRGDTIVAVGDLSAASATTTVDARDQIISPGFIDLLGQSQSAVLTDPHLEATLLQRVTTELTSEGFSPGPSATGPWKTLADYFAALEKNGSALNFALFVGASNPRDMVIGDINRPPTADEMRQMEAIVDQ